MKTVFKFKINSSITRIQIGAKFLRFAMQNSDPTAWFEVNPQNHSEDRELVIHPTGGKIPDNHQYLGTCFDGPFVWHLYESNSTVKTKGDENG